MILSLSIGLGFFNEFRSEKAVEALHSQIRHSVLAMRDGHSRQVDETELVPGDVVHLDVGDVIPADLRLLQVTSLQCDEAILTGEAMPAPKQTDPVTEPGSPVDLPDCAFMGTIVRAGTGRAVVVETGPKHRVRQDRAQPGRAARRDGVPSGTPRLLEAAREDHLGPVRRHLLDQHARCTARSWTLRCSRSRSPSGSRPSCCRRSSRSACRPARSGWRRSRSWSVDS